MPDELPIREYIAMKLEAQDRLAEERDKRYTHEFQNIQRAAEKAEQAAASTWRIVIAVIGVGLTISGLILTVLRLGL